MSPPRAAADAVAASAPATAARATARSTGGGVATTLATGARARTGTAARSPAHSPPLSTHPIASPPHHRRHPPSASGKCRGLRPWGAHGQARPRRGQRRHLSPPAGGARRAGASKTPRFGTPTPSWRTWGSTAAVYIQREWGRKRGANGRQPCPRETGKRANNQARTNAQLCQSRALAAAAAATAAAVAARIPARHPLHNYR